MQIEMNMTHNKTYTWEEVKKNPGAYKTDYADDNDFYLLNISGTVLYVGRSGIIIAQEGCWKDHKYIKASGTITLRF